MFKSDRGQQLWLAAVLLTRVPLPHLPKDAFAKGVTAVWAYPIVGAAVGACAVVMGQFAIWAGLPALSAAIIALGTMMLITGDMHEDGLADVVDGFWGGYTPERRLEIMRDSQIGTFGVLALLMVSLLRLTAISALLVDWWPAIIGAAVISRAMMPTLMSTIPHARRDGLAHSVGQPSTSYAAVALAVGAVVALLFVGASAFIGLMAAIVVTFGVALLAKNKIDGHTGDVLGATQQLSEVAVLLCLTAIL